MKVAICFYGQPRFYEEAYIQWSKYISQLNADVYVHTWWGENMVGELYPCAPHAKLALSDDVLLVKDDIIDNIKRLYNPSEINYDSYNDEKFKGKTHAFYQFYTQFSSKELCRKSNIDYDVVIRTRFDLYVNVPIPINIESNTIYTSTTTPYRDAPNDTLSISDLDTFFKIGDTLLNLDKFKGDVVGLKHETYLEKQIQFHNIKKQTFPATYDTFDVVRDNTVQKLGINTKII